MDDRQRALVRELHWGSSLLFLLLCLVTLGIFNGLYVWRQTRAMNRHLDRDERMWLTLPGTVLLLFAGGAVLLLCAMLLNDVDMFTAERISIQVAMVLALLWGFRARRRMNDLLDAEPGDDAWFSWVATLLLPTLYFNYKVNRLNRLLDLEAPRPPAARDQR